MTASARIFVAVTDLLDADVFVERRPAVLARPEGDGGDAALGETDGVVEGVLAVRPRLAT